MSTPYAPQPPKKLLRSRSNRFLFGVCGGLADYLNMDPTLVRILTVLISLFTGVPVLVYLVAVFVVPEAGSVDAPGYPPVNPPPYGVGPQGKWQYGPYDAPAPTYPSPSPQTAPRPADPVWGAQGAPWEQPPAQPYAGYPADPPAPGAGSTGATEPTPENPAGEDKPAS